VVMEQDIKEFHKCSLNLDTLERKTSQDLRIKKYDVIKESIGF